MGNAQQWYIVKGEDGTCQIVTSAPGEKYWGPFSSPEAAIAKRIGLIRAGLCQPQ
jgi:hypothetical protein